MNLTLGDAGYRFDERYRVWSRANPSETARFSYNDGDAVEQYIWQVVSDASDVRCGSGELCRAIRDWPSLYHLHPARASLLRPFADLLTGSVLEIGAGCGALTRFLGELGGQVLALEGSQRRAAIAAERCRDLNNVAVVQDTFDSCALNTQFDVVVVVGVLEYCGQFADNETPQSFLARCRRLLREGGHLVLAIENQLGLKYFAGAPEDHLGISYFGIENRYSQKSAVTWGRRELVSLLTSAGMPHVHEFYPFPDYKIPQLLLSQDALADASLLSDLLAQYGSATDTGKPYERAFSESAAWAAVARNGLVPDLANSFLLVGSSAPIRPYPASYIYSAHRRRELQKQTQLLQTSTGIAVHCAPLYNEACPVDPEFDWKLNSTTFHTGKLYSTLLGPILLRNDWTVDELVGWAKPYYEFLQRHVIPNSAALLPGEMLDCGPVNLVLNPDNVLVSFDLEWISHSAVPLGYIFFRALAVCFTREKAAGAMHPEIAISDLICQITASLGLIITNDDLAEYVRREQRLHSYVNGFPVDLKSEHWCGGALARKLPSPSDMPRAVIEADRKKLEADLEDSRNHMAAQSAELNACRADNAAKQAAITMLEQQLAVASELASKECSIRTAMQTSLSWQVTEPLRSAAARLRRLLRS